MATGVDVRPPVDELVGLIERQPQDNRLKWGADGSVKVILSRVFPDGSGYKQTVQRRRKRLKEALAKRLADVGWLATDRGWFTKETKKGV